MIYSYACYLLVEFCAQNINVPCTCYTAHHVRATLRTMYVLSRTYMYVITDQVIVNDLSGILFIAFVIAPAFNIKQCSLARLPPACLLALALVLAVAVMLPPAASAQRRVTHQGRPNRNQVSNQDTTDTRLGLLAGQLGVAPVPGK